MFVNDAAGRVEIAARTALAAMAEGDMLRTLLAALRRFMKVDAGQHRRAAARDRGCGRRARRDILSSVRWMALDSRAIERVVRSGESPRALGGWPCSALARVYGAEVPYEEEIATWRADKDRFMRESPDSPVPPAAARDLSAAALLPDQPASTACRRR